MRYQSDRPRAHHYDFAHRMLPALARRGRIGFLTAPTQARLDEFLQNLWQSVGQHHPAEDRLPGDGLRAEVTIAGSIPVLLIIMPPACHGAEAHFVAITAGAAPGTWRCLTLEHTWTREDKPATVLAEWTADGRHVSYGPGPAPNRPALLAALARLLSGADGTGQMPTIPDPRQGGE
jgi:hypothetical protein